MNFVETLEDILVTSEDLFLVDNGEVTNPLS